MRGESTAETGLSPAVSTHNDGRDNGMQPAKEGGWGPDALT